MCASLIRDKCRRLTCQVSRLDWGLDRQLLQRRDNRHTRGGEHLPPLKLKVLVLLQKHRVHQPCDPGVVVSFISSLTRSSRLMLQTSPALMWEVAEGKHVLTSLEHELCCPG